MAIRDSSRNMFVLQCIVITILVFMIQNLLSPTLSVVARDLNISDIDKDFLIGGQLPLGFFFGGSLSALMAGLVAVELERYAVLGLMIFIGEVATFATYWAQSYNHLLICRTFAGVAVGGFTPIMYAILAYSNPKSSHIYVTTLLNIAMMVGIGLGQLFSGMTLEFLNSWRLPFLIIPIPTCIFFVVFIFTSREPILTHRENVLLRLQTNSSTTSTIPTHFQSINNCLCNSKFYQLWKTSTLLLCLIEIILESFPNAILYIFFNDYLITNQKISILSSSSIIVFMFMGSVLGKFIGHSIGKILYTFDERWRCLLMSVCTTTTVIPAMYLMYGPPSHIALYFTMSFLCGLLPSITYVNLLAVLQNVSAPDSRALTLAISSLLEDICRGLAPLAVAAISQFYQDRRKAFTIGLCCWLVCSCVFFVMTFTVRRDEANVETRLRNALDQAFGFNSGDPAMDSVQYELAETNSDGRSR